MKYIVLDTPNIKEPINSHQTKLEDDGKVRFLLEEDENEETNIEESNNDSNEAIDFDNHLEN